eukprot:GILI01023453.1.p1 GENE.GILI01023453.1~~GILI01023453.1.p1  ORF type:complete len:203 (+),score=35.94 GILI01023453.1:67-609(+)
MISPVEFIFRVCHVVGSMTILALQFNALLRTEPVADSALITISPLPALGLTAPIAFSGVMAAEIVSTIVLLAGGINAMLLKPRVNMANTPDKSRNWRFIVYGLKLVLFIAATPVAKVVARAALVTHVEPATTAYTLEVERTAAAIRIGAILAASLVGTFARYYREEATALSTALAQKKLA